MTITTDMFKSGNVYTVRLCTDYGVTVAEDYFMTRLDAETAKRLVDAATEKLTGEKKTANDKRVEMLASAINDRLHGVR